MNIKLLKTVLIPVLILLLIGCVGTAEADEGKSPRREHTNPGGSPFPPGKEPSLTHTVKVFWTVMDPIDRTVIQVTAPGNKPSQVRAAVPDVKIPGHNRTNPVPATISPNSRYRFIIVRKNDHRKYEFGRIIRHDGMGTMIIRIYGFTAKDYKTQPVIKASYYHKGKLMGITNIKLHPVSKKIRKKERIKK